MYASCLIRQEHVSGSMSPGACNGRGRVLYVRYRYMYLLHTVFVVYKHSTTYCENVFIYACQKVEGRKMQLLEEVKVIASSDRGFKNYKEKLRNINPPCVPFVGMYICKCTKYTYSKYMYMKHSFYTHLCSPLY